MSPQLQQRLNRYLDRFAQLPLAQQAEHIAIMAGVLTDLKTSKAADAIAAELLQGIDISALPPVPQPATVAAGWQAKGSKGANRGR